MRFYSKNILHVDKYMTFHMIIIQTVFMATRLYRKNSCPPNKQKRVSAWLTFAWHWSAAQQNQYLHGWAFSSYAYGTNQSPRSAPARRRCSGECCPPGRWRPPGRPGPPSPPPPSAGCCWGLPHPPASAGSWALCPPAHLPPATMTFMYSRSCIHGRKSLLCFFWM